MDIVHIVCQGRTSKLGKQLLVDDFILANTSNDTVMLTPAMMP